MRKHWKKLSVCVVFTAVAFIWLSTCDIGLGSSVDTQAPSLEIVNPQSSVVYSGDIPVDGTWSDDKGVSKIEITVKDTNKNTVVDDFDPTATSANCTVSSNTVTCS